MSRGSSSSYGGKSAAMKKAKKSAKKKEELTRKKPSSSSSEVSGRGERERTKWRKKKREQEAEKKKMEGQKKDVKKHLVDIELMLKEAANSQKAVEEVMSLHRESKNMIKFQLTTESTEIAQTHLLEKMHISRASDRIRFSEIELSKLESELTKTQQVRDDYIINSKQNWYVRLWKFLY